jgi:hypothetical protein
MYRIQTEPRYWWPVKIRQPDPAKPGAIVEHELEAEFKWLPAEKYEAWLEHVGQAQLADKDAMPEVCTGFRKVRQEDGSELANTPDNLALLLGSDKAVARAFAAAFFESRAKAAEKN